MKEYDCASEKTNIEIHIRGERVNNEKKKEKKMLFVCDGRHNVYSHSKYCLYMPGFELELDFIL